jgi:hypothetical protein
MTNEDEYELFFNHINSLMERRKSVTATYLSVDAAITGAVAFLFKDSQLQDWTQQISVLVLLVAGIASCTLWRRLIQIGGSFRLLRDRGHDRATVGGVKRSP